MTGAAILHTESSMNMGGQEMRILMEMEGLSARGFISVLAARPGSGILNEALARGLKAYPVVMRGSFDPLAVAHLMRLMAREKIDVVNAHGSKDGWSAGFAARLSGRKVIRSRHVANPIRKGFFSRMVYGALCDRVMTTGEYIRQGMVARGVRADKIVSIPTGVDEVRFHPGVEKGRFRAELKIDGKIPLVGMVAIMRADKGPDVFIKAGELVLDKVPDAMFVLVGDGWMRARLEAQIAQSRHAGGFVMTGHRSDIPSVMADLDVLVLPARSPEGVPQVILQAHAMKVPVISSDVGGINEVAVPGRTAVCVPPEAPDALADAIANMLADPEKGRAPAEEGHALVMERYTLSTMLERMEALYMETLNAP